MTDEQKKTWTFDPSKYEGHTPGPWAADDIGPAGWADIRVAGSWQPPHAYAVPILGIPSINDVAANARLIADAPHLLAELVKEKAEVERLRNALRRLADEFVPEDNDEAFNALKHARRVLGEEGGER